MVILALDTATAVVTAGIVDLETSRTLASRATPDAHKHAEVLSSHVRDCLNELSLAFTDIEAVVVGAGPGPFTGLRVGMASGAVFANALGRPLYTACTLDAIALTAATELNEPFLVATDARRREVYWSIHSATGAPLTSPGVAKPSYLRTWLDGDVPDIGPGQPPVGIDQPISMSVPRKAVGAGAVLHADSLGYADAMAVDPMPLALAQVAAAKIAAKAPNDALTPLYLRRPDAVAPNGNKSVLP
ncbi:MAG: tRNA (adenosine(37)-N6)-threonylcarbamoyltransferase complex dimerization subunit type 1 TsaB [Corynebacteriales bacterium]|nr:tRNA (adenosine(37)-N6)-threonylcarbamoyltransferase complex dimerization subunit type 1 TsaB [Mycobacteriales bacterium]